MQQSVVESKLSYGVVGTVLATVELDSLPEKQLGSAVCLSFQTCRKTILLWAYREIKAQLCENSKVGGDAFEVFAFRTCCTCK